MNIRTSLIPQLLKSLPAMQETQIRFLGWEDPLEKEMATHSSTLAWRIPWTEEPGMLQSMGSQESDMTERLSTHSTNEYSSLVRLKYSICFYYKTYAILKLKVCSSVFLIMI